MVRNSQFIRNFAPNMRKVLWIILAVLLVTACGNKRKEEAEQMLSKAETEFGQRRFDRALITIDSLRKVYPEAIDVRKRALALYQTIELTRAQEELAVLDSALQAVNRDYEKQRRHVEQAKSELRATAEELTQLTRTRVHRDSLQTRYDVLCAKIRYIHHKQKEQKPL